MAYQCITNITRSIHISVSPLPIHDGILHSTSCKTCMLGKLCKGICSWIVNVRAFANLNIHELLITVAHHVYIVNSLFLFRKWHYICQIHEIFHSHNFPTYGIFLSHFIFIYYSYFLLKEAPRKPLPLIVPIRPTIRRLQLGSSRNRALQENSQEESQSTGDVYVYT